MEGVNNPLLFHYYYLNEEWQVQDGNNSTIDSIHPYYYVPQIISHEMCHRKVRKE